MQMERALVEFPFIGLDTKTDAKIVQPGKLLALENGVLRKGLSILKRNGYRKLSTKILDTPGRILGAAQRITAAAALARLGDELLLVGDGELYSWAPSLLRWIDKGAISPVAVSAKTIIRNTFQQFNPDVATLKGITVYVWSDTRTGVYATVIDEESGVAILSDYKLSPPDAVDGMGVRPRAIALDTSIVVIYQSEDGEILARSLAVANPKNFTFDVTLAADASLVEASQHLELCPSFAANAAAFAYNTAAGAIAVGYVLRDGTLGTPANGFVDATTIADAADYALSISLQVATGDLYLLYSSVIGLRSAALFRGLTSKNAPAVVDAQDGILNITAVFDDDGVLRTFYEIAGSSAQNELVNYAYVFDDGSLGEIDVLARSVGLAGKAFLRDDGRIYLGVVHDPSPSDVVDGLQNTYFLLRDDAKIVAKLQPGTADRLQVGQIPSIVELENGTYLWAMPIRTQFVSEGAATPGGANVTYSLVGLGVTGIDFAGSLRSVEMNGVLLFTGGVLGCYDGHGIVEHGFHLFPENPTAVVTDGGGSMEAGTRQICFVWAWYDAKGNREQSAPSVPVSFTTAGGASFVTCQVPTLRLTDKHGTRTDAVLEAYSTEQAGVIFYKVGNGAGDPTTAPVYNDPTVDSITFVRTVADTQIIANEILYTAGGIVENIAAPAAELIAVSKTRVFIVTAENRLRVWYSKRIIKNDATAFSDLFYFDVSPVGGDILAMEVMDDKLLLFRESRIEMVTGEGPNETGLSGDFSPAILITTDVGCSAPDSIAVTAEGICFKAAKGIYMLSRGLQAQYVGAPVEKYNDLDIVSATLLADVNEVRFLTSEGTALVWNTFFGEWSTFTNHAAVDGMLWDGLFLFADAAGAIHLETPGVYLDVTRNIVLRIKTAWMKLAGIQGFMRVRSASFLGEFFSNHLLQVNVAYDYKDFAQDFRPWNPIPAVAQGKFGDDSPFGDPVGGVFGGTADPVYRFIVPLKKQKCGAVQFEIFDAGSSTGQAYSLAAIALEVGLKQGAFRQPVAKIVA